MLNGIMPKMKKGKKKGERRISNTEIHNVVLRYANYIRSNEEKLWNFFLLYFVFPVSFSVIVIVILSFSLLFLLLLLLFCMFIAFIRKEIRLISYTYLQYGEEEEEEEISN